MKRLLIAMLMGLPLAATAQDNTWEKAAVTTTANADQKYLEGAVPVVDGQVVFETTIKAPGKTGKQIYDIMLNQLQQLSMVLMQDPLAANYLQCQMRFTVMMSDVYKIVGEVSDFGLDEKFKNMGM